MSFIQIPCRPHVRQWMLAEFGPEPEANQRNLLGVVILNASSSMHRKELKRPGSAEFGVHVSLTLEPHCRTERILFELGYLLEEHFTLAVISFVMGYTATGRSAHASFLAFMQRYSINEDDFALESLRKIWRDHCARRDRQFEKVLARPTPVVKPAFN